MEDKSTPKVYLAVPIVNYYDSEITSLLGKILTDLGFEISSPWVLSGKDVGKTPEEIFFRDINAVKSSDILLAEISKPSHGVGMEIMEAYESKKRIILVAREDSNISFLVRGIPGAILLEYRDYVDLEGKLRKILKEMRSL